MGILGREDHTIGEGGMRTLNTAQRGISAYGVVTQTGANRKTCEGCIHDRRGLVCGKDERLNFEHKWCVGYERV